MHYVLYYIALKNNLIKNILRTRLNKAEQGQNSRFEPWEQGEQGFGTRVTQFPIATFDILANLVYRRLRTSS